MRPARHLDPLEIEQFDEGAARLGDRDPSSIDRHPRLVERFAAVRGHAAHHEAGIVGRLVLDVEARHVTGDLLEIVQPEIVDELAVERGQRDRHVDDALLTKLGGDDHVLFVGALGRRGDVLGRVRARAGVAANRAKPLTAAFSMTGGPEWSPPDAASSRNRVTLS